MTQPYQLWYYSISHSVLLVRKPGTNGEPNHDHYFYNVKYFDFTDGLIFDTLDVSVYEVGADPNHPSIYDLIGEYKGEQINAAITASGHKYTTNYLDLFEYE